MSAEMDVEAAIEVCERWFRYLERQKEKTLTLQKAANLARAGKVDEARRIRAQVDSAPQVFDGAMLHPAVAALVDSARSQAEEIARLRMANEASIASRDHVYEALDATARQEISTLARQLQEAVEEITERDEVISDLNSRLGHAVDMANLHIAAHQEAVEERDKYKAALEQFATNELSSLNCASVDVAASRVRLVARAALNRSKP